MESDNQQYDAIDFLPIELWERIMFISNSPHVFKALGRVCKSLYLLVRSPVTRKRYIEHFTRREYSDNDPNVVTKLCQYCYCGNLTGTYVATIDDRRHVVEYQHDKRTSATTTDVKTGKLFGMTTFVDGYIHRLYMDISIIKNYVSEPNDNIFDPFQNGGRYCEVIPTPRQTQFDNHYEFLIDKYAKCRAWDACYLHIGSIRALLYHRDGSIGYSEYFYENWTVDDLEPSRQKFAGLNIIAICTNSPGWVTVYSYKIENPRKRVRVTTHPDSSVIKELYLGHSDGTLILGIEWDKEGIVTLIRESRRNGKCCQLVPQQREKDKQIHMRLDRITLKIIEDNYVLRDPVTFIPNKFLA